MTHISSIHKTRNTSSMGKNVVTIVTMPLMNMKQGNRYFNMIDSLTIYTALLRTGGSNPPRRCSPDEMLSSMPIVNRLTSRELPP